MIKKELIVGHQPQFLPYLGIFNKILKSDIFVFVDSVKFSKKSWYNRTLIKDKKDIISYLTIPVIQENIFIKDIKIANQLWKKKQLKSIELIYKQTNYFKELFPMIEKIVKNKSNFLIDYTIPSMQIILENLGFSNKRIFTQSSENITGVKNDLLINITKHFNSKKYLSGLGAKNYVDEIYLNNNGIEHEFIDFEHPIYKQQGKIFSPNLSVIDCIFNIGFQGLKDILKKKVN